MSLWGIDDKLWQPLEAAYWASKPPEVAALRELAPGSPAREVEARRLALAGNIIDVPIDVWGWVVFMTMTLREQFGYTWVPSALQPALVNTPGNNLPGQSPYDPANPPEGSIKVSVDLKDYPAYKVPQPSEVPSLKPIIGANTFDNVYTYGPGAVDDHGKYQIQNGLQITQDNKTYTAHRSTGLMGETLYFTLN